MIVYFPQQTTDPEIVPGLFKLLGERSGTLQVFFFQIFRRLISEPPSLQVREVRIHWQEATGPCKARHLTHHLWNGEQFHLQIDSHMRFVPGWDSKLKHMLQQAEQMAAFGKAVISTYPPPYEVCVFALLLHWTAILVLARLLQQSDSLCE